MGSGQTLVNLFVPFSKKNLSTLADILKGAPGKNVKFMIATRFLFPRTIGEEKRNFIYPSYFTCLLGWYVDEFLGIIGSRD